MKNVISLGSMCHTLPALRLNKRTESLPFNSVNVHALENTVNVLKELQEGILDVNKFLTVCDDDQEILKFNNINKYSIDWKPHSLLHTNKYGIWAGHHVPNKPASQPDDNVTTFTRRFERLYKLLNSDEECILVYYNRERNVDQRHNIFLNEISELYKTKHPFVYIDAFNSADNSKHPYNKTFHLNTAARTSTTETWNEITGCTDYILSIM